MPGLPTRPPLPLRGAGETQGPTSLALSSAMPLLRHTGVAIYASCAQKRAIHLLPTWSLCTFCFLSLSLSLFASGGDGQNLKLGRRRGRGESSVWSLAQSLYTQPCCARFCVSCCCGLGPDASFRVFFFSSLSRAGLVLACGCCMGFGLRVLKGLRGKGTRSRWRVSAPFLVLSFQSGHSSGCE